MTEILVGKCLYIIFMISTSMYILHGQGSWWCIKAAITNEYKLITPKEMGHICGLNLDSVQKPDGRDTVSIISFLEIKAVRSDVTFSM